jgi:hypothetical protein
LEYFDGALADAPAVAGPDTSNEPERSASAPAMVTRHLFMVSLHLVRDNSNGMGVPDTAKSAFPVDDSIRRLVVPGHGDPNARQAQQTSAYALKISS